MGDTCCDHADIMQQGEVFLAAKASGRMVRAIFGHIPSVINGMAAPVRVLIALARLDTFTPILNWKFINIALLIYCDFIHNKSTLNVTGKIDESHQHRKTENSGQFSNELLF
jgi:hypothetical protein